MSCVVNSPPVKAEVNLPFDLSKARPAANILCDKKETKITGYIIYEGGHPNGALDIAVMKTGDHFFSLDYFLGHPQNKGRFFTKGAEWFAQLEEITHETWDQETKRQGLNYHNFSHHNGQNDCTVEIVR